MTMILSAARKLSASEMKTANKIKLKQLIKEATIRLRRAEAVTDEPSKSKTPGPSSDLGNQPIEDTEYPQSVYSSKEEMIAALIQKGLSQQAAEAAASEVFGPGDDPREASRKLAQAKHDLQIKLVNKGFGLAAARTLAADVYGENTTADWTSSTETKNAVGGHSVIKTSMPRFGEIQLAPQSSYTIGHSKGVEPLQVRKTKQASVRDIAAWAICADAVEPDSTITLDSGIRNASAIPSYFYDVDASWALERKQLQRQSRNESMDKQAIKSAQLKYPAHLYAYGAEYLP